MTVAAGTTLTVNHGESLLKPIVLKQRSGLDNAGTVGGSVDIAVEGNAQDSADASVRNHDGGSIKATDAAVWLRDGGSVTNGSGGIIEGGALGVVLGAGGQVTNDGAGSLLRSTTGITVQVLGDIGTVVNTGGGTISGASTAIYLQHGGSITNGSGSTIETSGTAAGDCGIGGDCAIFVASDGDTTSNAGGSLTLVNAGTIIGNVQLISTAANFVTLSSGSSIAGNLAIGSNHQSSLTLNGGAGTYQLYSQAVTGTTTFAGNLFKTGDGVWTIDNGDIAADATAISGGTLQIGNGGTQGSIGQGNIAISAGTLAFNRSDDVDYSGNISGSGSVTQSGNGMLTLSGANTYLGGTTISHGTLRIGDGGMTGSLMGDVLNNGSLLFDRSDDVTLNGMVSGSGALAQAGNGTLTLTTTNAYLGGTTISSGTLQVGNGGTTGSIVGDVFDDGFLGFNRSDDTSFAGSITGTGGLIKKGLGALTLTGYNAYTGTTQVNAGSLYVDGYEGVATGATNVNSGATLGGMGILGGDVSVADGATLAPGSHGGIGTLTINGNLALSAGSNLDYSLGQANVRGGPLNDLTNVNGNLILDGTLNVNAAPGGNFGPGIYRLFNYTGTLIDNGLTLGSVPFSGALVQTVVDHQVNLVNADGRTYSFWDGDAGPKNDHAINGGDGTWESGNSVTDNNWTDVNGAVNAAFSDRSFAVFQGAPGTVTVDHKNGDINAAGMQFDSDGYNIQGDAIHLVGSASDPTHSIVRVGDGTTAGASYKATINSQLDGDVMLVKTDAGTLVLTGDNTYTGGTTISGGTLQIGNGGETGSILGDVTDNGSLVFNRSDEVAFAGVVSGTGALNKSGTGRVILTGSNSYAGGTIVKGGILEIASGAEIGAGNVSVGRFRGPVYFQQVLQVDNGASLSNHIVLSSQGILDNAGVLGGTTDNPVESANIGSSSLLNHDGGSITGTNSAVAFGNLGTVENRSGGIIEGGNFGVQLQYGGMVTNEGVGSIIRSPNGIGLQILEKIGDIENTAGGVITGGSTAIYLQHGGKVTNSVGSTIETTDPMNGDCGGVGHCAIFVPSADNPPSSFTGQLTLFNAGDIFGNVQMAAGASNTVTLSAGGTIHGDLDFGSNNSGYVGLTGDSGTVELYSQAVTGATTFAGGFAKTGDGTWIIDNDDVVAGGASVNGGTLQVGNGGTKGSIGQAGVSIAHGSLVFDRSDDVTYEGSISGGNSEAYDSTLVQAGTGTLTLLAVTGITPKKIRIERGTLQIDNTGDMTGCGICTTYLSSDVENNGSLIFDSYFNIYGGAISGTGSVILNGLAEVVLPGENTYTGGTTINKGKLLTLKPLAGNVVVNEAGALDGYSGATLHSGVPAVAGNLVNGGKVFVRLNDSAVGGNYTQNSTGTLAVSLGSKLDVSGTATLHGGALEINGADSGYVSNMHTDVLTANEGVTGTFDQLVKDTGVVFTATTINYDANSVWLDTTGLDVTKAAAGGGVSYTAASMGAARRVQGAFEQLNAKIASADLSKVSTDFVHSAGQFQQAPNLQAAQASLQSLSGQLHAVSAAMTFKAINASSRALSDRFDNVLGKTSGFGMWMQNLNVGGDMTRVGYNGVGFQVNGWLVGSDRKIGRSGVAGFAFGQNQGHQQLNQSYDHDNSRSTEGMLYAGWLSGNWYTQGRVGFGQFQQDVSRKLLLGYSAQNVQTGYGGRYGVAYGESGLRFETGRSQITPYLNVEYARIGRDGFAEQGAGGFGLRSNAQTLDRWQAGLGVRAGHHWNLDGGRAVDFSMRAQWQRTLASHGDVFDASFVGLREWQPLVGIGLSRYSGLIGIGLDATLSAHTALNFGYDYETGQRDNAQTLSARFKLTF